MDPKIGKRGSHLEGFPFPLQAPSLHDPVIPPATRSESPESHNAINGPFYPFLTNVGQPKSTIIVRGGFLVEREPPEYPVRMKCYPPPPNAAYDLTSQAHVPGDPATLKFKACMLPLVGDGSDSHVAVDKKCTTSVDHSSFMGIDSFNGVENLDGTATEDVDNPTAKVNDLTCIDPIQKQLNQSIRREIEPRTISNAVELENRHQQKTMGEVLADTIDFERSSWLMTSPGVSGYLYHAEELREDYIRFIDGDTPKLEHCKKCKITHIPPGPPITLEDRDTCGAYLPEWFPAEEYEKPWKALKKMINDMVYLTELTQGFNHKPNPDAPVWDLEFHDYSQKWKAVGRRGGWWKCRDGEAATDVERECQLCHADEDNQVDVDQSSAGANNRSIIEERLKAINDFIDLNMKRVCEKDKAIVAARSRAEAIPHSSRPRPVDETRFSDRDWDRWASSLTVQRSYSMDTAYSSVAYGSPAAEIPLLAEKLPLSENDALIEDARLAEDVLQRGIEEDD